MHTMERRRRGRDGWSTFHLPNINRRGLDSSFSVLCHMTSKYLIAPSNVVLYCALCRTLNLLGSRLKTPEFAKRSVIFSRYFRATVVRCVKGHNRVTVFPRPATWPPRERKHRGHPVLVKDRRPKGEMVHDGGGMRQAATADGAGSDGNGC